MRPYFLFLFACFTISAYGQVVKTAPCDTILFNSGQVLATHVLDTFGDKVTVENPNSSSHKKKEIERSNIFSIRYANTHKEIVFYVYDSLIGNDFTVQDARLFIAGEQDARRGFHAVGTSIGAFIIGFASSYIGYFGASFFVFVPPFLYSGVMAYPRVYIRHKCVSNLNCVKSDAYLYGYDNTARRRRVLRSLLWGTAGLVTGYLAHAFAAVNEPRWLP
jgi:hypothetical protein